MRSAVHSRNFLLGVIWIALGSVSLAEAAGVTNAGDDMRTGWYPEEGFITPSIVGSPAFAQRWNITVNGQVIAQPLYHTGQVLIATENNQVYNLDADTGTILWSRSFGAPFSTSEVGCNQVAPSAGVTSTPVIDDEARIVYLASMQYTTGSSGPVEWNVHALNLDSGKEIAGFPVKLQGAAQNAPAQTFNAFRHQNRPGLLLMGGVVYVALGSHCDIGPYQGWIFGVSTAGQITARWTSRAATGTNGAAIWQSGGGMVSDGPGRIFFATGNGGAPTTARVGSNPPTNCGECVMRVNVQPDGPLLAQDFFAPSNAGSLDTFDRDLGSSAQAGLPSAYFGTSVVRNLLVQSSKEGYLYLMNRDDLGGVKQGAGATDKVVQRLGPYQGVWNRPSVWPGDGGYVYLLGSGGPLKAFKYGVDGTNKPTLTNTGNSTDTFGYGSGSPIITSDGTTNGSALVWVVRMNDGSGTGGQLRAYDAVPSGANLVQRFSTPIGLGAKYAPPGAGRGMILVGTLDGHVIAFGAPAAELTLTKTATAVHLAWSNNAAPYTLRRADDARFKLNSSRLVDKQPLTSFDDAVLGDGKNYFYLVN